MGFVHSTQIQNKSHPHPHLPDAITATIQDLRPFVVAAICLRRLLLQNGYHQGIITYQYINDVTKRTINKSNNHVSTVPRKTIIITLSSIVAHFSA